QLLVQNAAPGTSGVGVSAVDAAGTGLKGTSTSGTGVYAVSDSGAGLRAKSTSGPGVVATAGGAQPALKAQNTGSGPGAAFTGGAGAPPFTVNSSLLVPGLNADWLDGINSTYFALRDDGIAWHYIGRPR